MATKARQAETARGCCPDGQPHHWVLDEPEYEWRGTEYVELTEQWCRRCDAQRQGACPIAADVWIDGQGTLIGYSDRDDD